MMHTHSDEPSPLSSLPAFVLSPGLGDHDAAVDLTGESLFAGQAVDSDGRRAHGMPHHPQLDASYAPAFGVPGVPGGDCRRLCVRHQRMVDGGAAARLQQSIENLSPADQSAVNTVWSLFSSSRAAQRNLVLRGLLSICCPSQLSFLSEQLKAECRIDPFSLLPREVSIKCLSHLDAISLGRAAQVSRAWRTLADDDLLWRTICQQHIERKCEKCGWGLPLLEKKRRVRTSTTQKQRIAASHAMSSPPKPSTSAAEEPPSPCPVAERSMAAMAIETRPPSPRPPKRARSEDGDAGGMDVDLPPSTTRSRPSSRSASRPSTPPLTKPWKSVYTERLVVERNWRKGSCAVSVLEGHTDAITCLQFEESFSFPVLMTGSWDRTVRIWNMETGACINVMRGHLRGVRALQFDSTKLITGSMDATLKIWSWRTGECVRTLQGHRDSVICLAYDRHLLASGSADSTIKLWDFSTGECVTFRGHREWVNSLQIWSPDACDEPTGADMVLNSDGNRTVSYFGGPADSTPPKVKLLFSGSDDGTIRVWDLVARTCVRVLNGHVAQVQSVRVINVPGNAGASMMAESVIDKTPVPSSAPASIASAQQSDYFDGAPPAACDAPVARRPQPMDEDEGNEEGEESRLAPLDFGSGQQPLLISASLDNTIKLWDIEAGKCQRTLFGHVEGVWSVDADKLRMVSGSHDRTVKVWDRSTGKCMHTLVGHRGAVTAVTLADDRMITGSDDGDIRIWNFSTQ